MEDLGGSRPRGTPVGIVRPETEGFSGLLAVDKPTGVTSHDVVMVVRRKLKSPSAGHLGTLDPGASGLLLLALGAARRAIPVWMGAEKTYQATLRLGIETDSQDVHGRVLAEREVRVTEAELRGAAADRIGESLQIPPMVSAVRVGGERLHRLARRGLEVERKPRPVVVRRWEWESIELPEARFVVSCTAGTYVRTLVHDLGQSLGCGAALQALRRLRCEPFGLDRAVRLRDIETEPASVVFERAGIALDEALLVLPAVTLDAEALGAIGFGGRPTVDAPEVPLGTGPRSLVFRDAAGRAAALGELRPALESPGRVLACPDVVFPWAVRQGRFDPDPSAT